MLDSPVTTERVDELARLLWDYHYLGEPLTEKADCLVALGGNDLRVPAHAARLWGEGWAEWLIVTGGIAHKGDLLETAWDRPEAEVFARVAMEAGVPADRILIEPRSSNTGENLLFARRLAEARGVPTRRMVVVSKPHMERRAKATAEITWPEAAVGVTSHPASFDEYPTPQIPRDLVINLIAGDTQRMEPYARLGYQTPQPLPPEVEAAYRELMRLGYDKHRMRE